MTLVRQASPDDLEATTRIYNHYVLNSHATFLSEPVAAQDRKPWFDTYQTGRGHLLLVIEENGTVRGFAGLAPYRNLDTGFEDTVEASVYLAPDATGRGLGRALYEALFVPANTMPFHRALAGIALPNDQSIALHERFGFRKIGTFSEYAKKNGQYLSSLWMEKVL